VCRPCGHATRPPCGPLLLAQRSLPPVTLHAVAPAGSAVGGRAFTPPPTGRRQCRACPQACPASQWAYELAWCEARAIVLLEHADEWPSFPVSSRAGGGMCWCPRSVFGATGDIDIDRRRSASGCASPFESPEHAACGTMWFCVLHVRRTDASMPIAIDRRSSSRDSSLERAELRASACDARAAVLVTVIRVQLRWIANCAIGGGAHARRVLIDIVLGGARIFRMHGSR